MVVARPWPSHNSSGVHLEGLAMHYSLMGFSQNGAIRRFRFNRIEMGVAPISVTVLADTSLARTFNLGLQELPSLCSRLLNASQGMVVSTLVLGEAEMSISAAENAALAADIEAARTMRSQRNSLASKARKADSGTRHEKREADSANHT